MDIKPLGRMVLVTMGDTLDNDTLVVKGRVLKVGENVPGSLLEADVLFYIASGQDLKIDGAKHKLVSADDLLAVVT